MAGDARLCKDARDLLLTNEDVVRPLEPGPQAGDSANSVLNCQRTDHRHSLDLGWAQARDEQKRHQKRAAQRCLPGAAKAPTPPSLLLSDYQCTVWGALCRQGCSHIVGRSDALVAEDSRADNVGSQAPGYGIGRQPAAFDWAPSILRLQSFHSCLALAVLVAVCPTVLPTGSDGARR